MTSLVFRAPAHIEVQDVMKWSQLHFNGQPQDLSPGEYVYIRHGEEILFRAPMVNSEFRQERPNSEGGDAGPGWVVVCGNHELPPPGWHFTSHPYFRQTHKQGIRYLYHGELW